MEFASLATLFVDMQKSSKEKYSNSHEIFVFAPTIFLSQRINRQRQTAIIIAHSFVSFNVALSNLHKSACKKRRGKSF